MVLLFYWQEKMASLKSFDFLGTFFDYHTIRLGPHDISFLKHAFSQRSGCSSKEKILHIRPESGAGYHSVNFCLCVIKKQ